MPGKTVHIALTPTNTVVGDGPTGVNWMSQIYNSEQFKGGGFMMYIIGVLGAGVSFQATLETSTDGINWIGTSATWTGSPWSAPGSDSLWPDDLLTYFRFSFSLTGNADVGVTYYLGANLENN